MSSKDLITEKFGDSVRIVEKSRKRIYVETPDKYTALSVVKFLYVNLKLRFSIASAVDERDGIEILYHMADDRDGKRITVRVLVEKPGLVMPSATPFMPSADWIEREIHEMFGVNFVGHPNLERLLLPDDWPDGVFPLRKGQ